MWTALREGIFFSRSKLGIDQILKFIYLWSHNMATVKNIRRESGINSVHTLTDWKNFERCMCWVFSAEPSADQRPRVYGQVGWIPLQQKKTWYWEGPPTAQGLQRVQPCREGGFPGYCPEQKCRNPPSTNTEIHIAGDNCFIRPLEDVHRSWRKGLRTQNGKSQAALC